MRSCRGADPGDRDRQRAQAPRTEERQESRGRFYSNKVGNPPAPSRLGLRLDGTDLLLKVLGALFDTLQAIAGLLQSFARDLGFLVQAVQPWDDGVIFVLETVERSVQGVKVTEHLGKAAT